MSSRPNPLYRMELFGGLRVRRDERELPRLSAEKTRALLAYLAYHWRHPTERDVLIEQFWPDHDLERGRNNLSHALTSLRHLLEPPDIPAGSVILAARQVFGLHPGFLQPPCRAFQAPP